MPPLKHSLKKTYETMGNFWKTKVSENQRKNIQSDDKVENKTK